MSTRPNTENVPPDDPSRRPEARSDDEQRAGDLLLAQPLTLTRAEAASNAADLRVAGYAFDGPPAESASTPPAESSAAYAPCDRRRLRRRRRTRDTVTPICVHWWSQGNQCPEGQVLPAPP